MSRPLTAARSAAPSDSYVAVVAAWALANSSLPSCRATKKLCVLPRGEGFTNVVLQLAAWKADKLAFHGQVRAKFGVTLLGKLEEWQELSEVA